MKKIAILSLSLLAFTGINFTAQAKQNIIATEYYNF